MTSARANEISDPNHEEVLALSDAVDVEAELRGFARRQLARVMQPRLLQLRRLVIGESGRFPELGRLFYQRGAGRTIAALARAFEALAARGELELDDPEMAASQFNPTRLPAPIHSLMRSPGLTNYSRAFTFNESWAARRSILHVPRFISDSKRGSSR